MDVPNNQTNNSSVAVLADQTQFGKEEISQNEQDEKIIEQNVAEKVARTNKPPESEIDDEIEAQVEELE